MIHEHSLSKFPYSMVFRHTHCINIFYQYRRDTVHNNLPVETFADVISDMRHTNEPCPRSFCRL